jgi:hypothetical protein
MLISKTAGCLASLAATCAVLVPATAEAARATFAVKVEAHRTVTWDHPRVEFGGDCNGKNYMEGNGSEDFKLTSQSGGRLVVEGSARRLSSWEFGTEGNRRTIVSESPKAKGVITRQRRWVTGRTGGWCGGAEQDPIKNGDCGTRLAPFTFRLSLYKDTVGIRESRGSATHEKYDFYDCNLDTPEGVPAGSLPSLEQKLPLAKLFNKGESTVTIKNSKSYGPSLTPLGNGSSRSTSAGYDWTITLTRIKNLKPRSENG